MSSASASSLRAQARSFLGALGLRFAKAHLTRQLVSVMLQHQIDALANVDGDGHLRPSVQDVQTLVLLRRDVDRRRDLLSRHGSLGAPEWPAVTIDSHTCDVNRAILDFSSLHQYLRLILSPIPPCPDPPGGRPPPREPGAFGENQGTGES